MKTDTALSKNRPWSPKPENLQPLAVGVEDACRMTGMGRSAIYEAMKRGELRKLKVGARTLFRVSDLAAWLDSKADEPTVAAQ